MTGNDHPCEICGKADTAHDPRGCRTGWYMVQDDTGNWITAFDPTLRGPAR